MPPPPPRAEPIAARDTRPLRQRVLRPHQAVRDCGFPGDDAAAAAHVGVRRGGALGAVGSVLPEEETTGRAPGIPWRIRGMAVAPEARGEGLGRAVLAALLAHVRGEGGEAVWCNARTTAAGFYTAHGFRVVGAPFELPRIGPHVVMVRRVGDPGEDLLARG